MDNQGLREEGYMKACAGRFAVLWLCLLCMTGLCVLSAPGCPDTGAPPVDPGDTGPGDEPPDPPPPPPPPTPPDDDPPTVAANLLGLSLGRVSVGDTVELSGSGFAPNAADNQVDFNGKVTTAVSYRTADDPPFGMKMYLGVVVPNGATSGPIRVKPAGATEWSNTKDVEVWAATVVTLDAGWEDQGVFVSTLHVEPLGVDEHFYGLHESWILGGSGFSALTGPSLYAEDGTTLAPGVSGRMDLLTLEAEIGGEMYYLAAEVVSDTQLYIPGPPDLDDLAAGDTFRVRVIGNEGWSLYRNKLLRYSDWLTLTVSERHNTPGAYHRIVPATLDFSWPAASSDPETPIEIARGDWLCFYDYARLETNMPRLTCPGLWDGVLRFWGRTTVPSGDPLGTMSPAKRGLIGRSIPLPKAGTYTVTNETTGQSRQIVVKNEGVIAGGCASTPGGASGSVWRTRDVELGSGGARVFVPAGAFPSHPPMPYAEDPDHYRLEFRYLSSSITPDDPEEEVTLLCCTLSFFPEPAQLLKPITITVPYGEDGDELPVLGAYDEDTGQFFKLAATVDEANHRIIFVLPAGRYPNPDHPTYADSPVPSPAAALGKTAGLTARALPTAAASSPTTPTGTGFPSTTLNKLTKRVGARFWRCSRSMLEDDDKHFLVDYVDDPGSDSYVTYAYANDLLNTMVATYNHLAGAGAGWKKPPRQLSVSIRAFTVWTDAYGSTSKGVFGDPTISINKSRCPAGSPAFYTAAAHEVGHAFQRQYTTNITTKWFDEASAEWVALSTVGATRFMTEAIHDAAPFIRTLPAGFYFGFSQAESYAASPWAIWLEATYPGSVRKVYEKWGNTDSYATFEAATGTPIGTMYDQFAEEFWTQRFEPLKNLVLDLDTAIQGQTSTSPRVTMTDWPGISVGAVRPVMSSYRHTFSLSDAFKSQVAGRPAAVRTTGLTGVARVLVYGENRPPEVQPDAPTKLLTLDDSRTAGNLGPVDRYRTYRIIVVNASKVNVPNVQVTVVVPRITSLSPVGGKGSGGYAVNVTGTGLGTQQGKILLGGQEVSINFWSDTSVSFTMPNVGDNTSIWQITLRTAEDVATNVLPFQFTR